MGVLGFALWLRMDTTANHYIRASYEIEQVTTYYIACYVVMGAGCALTFIGFLGCCGAFQESKCMLSCFFCVLFVVFGAQIATGVWIYFHKHKIEMSITDTFIILVQRYYGTTRDPLIDEAIDYVQKTLQCCGGLSPKDWRESTLVQQEILNQDRVPVSCCRDLAIPLDQQNTGICGISGTWDIEHEGYTHPAVYDRGSTQKTICEM